MEPGHTAWSIARLHWRPQLSPADRHAHQCVRPVSPIGILQIASLLIGDLTGNTAIAYVGLNSAFTKQISRVIANHDSSIQVPHDRYN